jgi:hypothetical protein
MKTNITETSLFAYEEIKPHLGAMQEKVLICVVEYHLGLTAKAISILTHKPINTVTARLNELMYEKQVIKVSHVKHNQSYYVMRLASDPLNIRKLTGTEKLEQFRAWLSGKGLFVATNEAIEKLNELINK